MKTCTKDKISTNKPYTSNSKVKKATPIAGEDNKMDYNLNRGSATTRGMAHRGKDKKSK